ncbi:hypothetical protein CIB48_g11495 [Xylaria polymorpha]|nr:hypothetical protein CIB48_g11495 [Xylaria polymorpha]
MHTKQNILEATVGYWYIRQAELNELPHYSLSDPAWYLLSELSTPTAAKGVFYHCIGSAKQNQITRLEKSTEKEEKETKKERKWLLKQRPPNRHDDDRRRWLSSTPTTHGLWRL